MKDRSQTIDLLLVFASTFVIALSWWPVEKPRQIVRCKHSEAGWATYSIALEDPRLADLQQRLDDWSAPESDTRFLAAKWEKETAEFYLADDMAPPSETTEKESTSPTASKEPATVRLSDTVATASYETPVMDLPAAEVTTGSELTVDRDHWQNVLDKANAVIAATAKTKASPPVVIDGQTSVGWPPLAFHMAFLLGVAGACFYMHWHKRAPLRRGMEFRDQPMIVLARIGTFVGFVGLAMLSALTVWI